MKKRDRFIEPAMKMERINAGAYTQPQTCIKCEEEYKANHITIFSRDSDLSRGKCPSCQAKIAAENAKKEEVARQAKIMAKRKGWRETCGIPLKFRERDFSTFEVDKQPTAYKQTSAYAEGYPFLNPRGYKSLVLMGGNGTGKTHLVCSIIHRVLDRWQGEEIAKPVYFTTEPDLFRAVQATFNYSYEERGMRETEEDIHNRLSRVPLLVIDDIGKEERQDKRFVQRYLFGVIDGRYKNELPTIFTTNLTPEELEVHLGGIGTNEASFDRLVEMTGGKFIRLKGDSYRRKPK